MKASIILFDNFTDIDLFLMWDLLARKKWNWDIKILGNNKKQISSNGISIETHGHWQDANKSEVVLFCSGRGTRELIQNPAFISHFSLNPDKQLIGSICSGALLLAKLGLLNGKTATTYPAAKDALLALGIEVIDAPFVQHGNIATAGGCLSAQYLVAWVVERLYGTEQRKAVLREISPVGQVDIYEQLVTQSIKSINKETVVSI
jgi:transcriptional regulator GlxA family with amidase domain